MPTSLAVFWGEDIQKRVGADAKKAGIYMSDYICTKAPPDLLLQSLSDASDRLAADFGTWKTPWGDINRFQRLTGDIVQPFNDAGPSIPVGFTSAVWGSLASFGARAVPGNKKVVRHERKQFCCGSRVWRKSAGASRYCGRRKRQSVITPFQRRGPTLQHREICAKCISTPRSSRAIPSGNIIPEIDLPGSGIRHRNGKSGLDPASTSSEDFRSVRATLTSDSFSLLAQIARRLRIFSMHAVASGTLHAVSPTPPKPRRFGELLSFAFFTEASHRFPPQSQTVHRVTHTILRALDSFNDRA